jgi:hypothetical protein
MDAWTQYTCPDWNIRCGPIVPQIKEALYITLAPLHVKRSLQRFLNLGYNWSAADVPVWTGVQWPSLFLPHRGKIVHHFSTVACEAFFVRRLAKVRDVSKHPS